MKYSLRRAGALVALLAVAFATAAHAADPADANAAVPPTRYQTFHAAPPAAVSTPSPSQQWKALNQVVASYDSMSLTMDMAEAAPAEGKMVAPPAAAGTPAAHATHVPDSPPARPPLPDAHAHHQPKAVK